eukprot:gene30814-38088_t
MKDSIGSNASYGLILLGTALVGLSQPFFANSPAKLSAVWFGVCVGSLLPPLLTAGESDGDVANGIRNLMMVQFILVTGSAVIQFLFFRNEPPTPPTGTMHGCLALINQFPDNYGNDEVGYASSAILVSGLIVECAYPIPEEACVGIMIIGMNLWGICITFIGQVLLGLPSSHHSAPFFPFGYFLMSMAAIAVVPVLTFKGRYLRLEMDTQRESEVNARGGSGQNPL